MDKKPPQPPPESGGKAGESVPMTPEMASFKALAKKVMNADREKVLAEERRQKKRRKPKG